MNAKITQPNFPAGTSQNVCVLIPFDTLELSVALNNYNGLSPSCNREDVRLYDRKTKEDVTYMLLDAINGSKHRKCQTVYIADGYKLSLLLNKIKDMDKKRNKLIVVQV